MIIEATSQSNCTSTNSALEDKEWGKDSSFEEKKGVWFSYSQKFITV
jgi:hypothetical protein